MSNKMVYPKNFHHTLNVLQHSTLSYEIQTFELDTNYAQITTKVYLVEVSHTLVSY